MDELILSILCIVVGAFLKPVAEHIAGLIVFNFGSMKIRELPKRWRTTWSYHDLKKNGTYNDIMEIKQRGPFIRGYASDERHKYLIRGKLHPDGCLQGTWKDKERDWYGSFKLLIESDGDRMMGKWIGKDIEDNIAIIRAGDWIWEKI